MADSAGIMVVVDNSDGGERRELYVDAKDLKKTDDISQAEYIRLLTERGMQKLAEYNEMQSIECVIDTGKMGNMAFSLGDRCTYRNDELSLSAEGRITEVQEVIENGTVSTNIILGKEQLSLTQKIKRGI